MYCYKFCKGPYFMFKNFRFRKIIIRSYGTDLTSASPNNWRWTRTVSKFWCSWGAEFWYRNMFTASVEQCFNTITVRIIFFIKFYWVALRNELFIFGYSYPFEKSPITPPVSLNSGFQHRSVSLTRRDRACIRLRQIDVHVVCGYPFRNVFSL